MAGRSVAEFLLLLILVHQSVSRELLTNEIARDAKMQCASSARSIYTVTSEMQCYHRCLQKDKCEILNYKGSSTKENCEVYDVKSDDHTCTSTLAANWKAVIIKRKEEKTVKVSRSSCKDIKADSPKAKNGVYELKSGKHYCIMDNLEGCGEGGWTLAMSINGDNATFAARSSYWEDTSTYNVENGLKSFESEEAKFPAFSSIAFTSICVGMKRNGTKRWLHISKNGSSLYHIFKGKNYQPTSLGRAKWLNLTSGANLEPHCNREGFNAKGDGKYIRIRIGILGNDITGCYDPDTYVGFGSSTSVACGSYGVSAMGYIMVK